MGDNIIILNYPRYISIKVDAEDIIIKEVGDEHIIISFWLQYEKETADLMFTAFNNNWFYHDIAEYYYVKLGQSSYACGYLIGYRLKIMNNKIFVNMELADRW